MIYVDDREKKLFEIKDILTNLNQDFEVKRLNNGDYLLNNKNTLLIERKNINDFLSNYGELRSRLFRMKREADYICLLLEGSPRERDGVIYQFRGHKMGDCAVMKYGTYYKFITREASDNCMIIPSDSLQHSIMAISAIHDYLPFLDDPKSLEMKLPVDEVLTLLIGMGDGSTKKCKELYNSPLEALKNCEAWMPKKTLEHLKKW